MTPQPTNNTQIDNTFTVSGGFFNKAKLTTADQPDGGDTWHISKKDWNACMDEIEDSVLANKKRWQIEARINEDKFWSNGLFNQDLSNPPYIDIATFQRRSTELKKQLESLSV